MVFCWLDDWTKPIVLAHLPFADTSGLPFQHEVNTGFGILAKTYLDAAVYHNNDSITEANMSTLQVVAAKQEAMLFVEQTFSSIRNPIQEIERGFRFWDTVSVGLVLRVWVSFLNQVVLCYIILKGQRAWGDGHALTPV
jgi:hypothetical protein